MTWPSTDMRGRILVSTRPVISVTFAYTVLPVSATRFIDAVNLVFIRLDVLPGQNSSVLRAFRLPSPFNNRLGATAETGFVRP